MTWDKEKFISEAALLFDNEAHKSVVDAKLPNNGEALETICSNGLAHLKKNSSALFTALI